MDLGSDLLPETIAGLPMLSAKPVEEGKSTEPGVATSSTLAVAPQGGTTMPEMRRATLDSIKRLVEVSLHATCVVLSFWT